VTVEKYSVNGFNHSWFSSSDIDDCAANPCVNGVCTDLVNDYECACNTGYEYKNCEHGKNPVS